LNKKATHLIRLTPVGIELYAFIRQGLQARHSYPACFTKPVPAGQPEKEV